MFVLLIYNFFFLQENATILNNCIKLFKKDCDVHVIENNGLCDTYPQKIIIPLSNDGFSKFKHCRFYFLKQELIYVIKENCADADKIKDLFDGSRYARLRDRFPVPVACFNGKNICRSATLAQKGECVAKAVKNGFSLLNAW